MAGERPDECMEYDVLLIGGSPSNLILAHHLLDLARESGASFTMAILEKGRDFGANIVSGAVSNPRVLKKLFPELAQPENTDFPLEAVCKDSRFAVLGNQNMWTVPNALLPPGLKKEGYFVLTLSHVVKWLYEKLEAKVAENDNLHADFFPGFAAHDVVYESGPAGHEKIVGVQVVEKPTGNPAEENIYAKVVCFGDKGFVSRKVIDKFNLRDNPQIWSVGVKEVWEVQEDYAGKVWHTMGFPLVDGSFGGGFVYGMKDKRLTVGLIASLDSPNPNLNPQQRLQDYKKHPWLQKMLSGGKLLKYGAAVLPEGGYYSLPRKFQADGAVILGDALGVLDISGLSGIDKSMESGYIAAEVIHDCLQKDDFSEAALSPYQTRLMESFVGKELKEGRYFRYAWQENPRLLNEYLPTVLEGIDGPGPWMGLINVGLRNNPVQALKDALRLKTMMDGKTDLGPVTYKKDYQHIVPGFQPKQTIQPPTFEEATVYSRPDAVFYADPQYHEGNMHIDEFSADTCIRCITTYDSYGRQVPCVADCTAEVHRVDDMAEGRRHGMSLENCIQCRTCEIVCPEENLLVRPAEQGSGPDFTGL